MKRVCVVDSGYRSDDRGLHVELIERAVTLERYGNGFAVREGAEDYLGHGTAILTILQQDNLEDCLYTVIKIFDESLECDEELLIYALQYIYDRVECDFINLSLGTSNSSGKKALLNICDKLYRRGTVIVAAFDNNGAVSYPAAFSCVIGVDSHAVCKKRDDVAFVEDSVVNVFAFGRVQRLSKAFTKYMYASGASVACAHVTRILMRLGIKGPDSASEALLEYASCVFYKSKKVIADIPSAIINRINKAILFPYNKEMHSVVKFNEMLPFSVEGIYDDPRFGLVGRKIVSYCGKTEHFIDSWKNIPWEADFDTVILGHLGEYSEASNEEWMGKMLALCKQYDKMVYCFDEAPIISDEMKSVEIEWPHKEYDCDKFGKLYNICCPVLGVFGTGSRQGKYTLQLILRKLFLENGYRVGQIGSEPSALLFGMDDLFHFGYNEKFSLSGPEFIEALNASMNEIQEKDVDIIIAGSQSGTVPYSLVNMRYATGKQIDFLTGINPDRVVLCANIFDDVEYVARTLSFIEALGTCKVIATVLFPMTFSGEYAMIGTPAKRASKDEILAKKREVMSVCNIPCFELGDEEEMRELFAVVINSFS